MAMPLKLPWTESFRKREARFPEIFGFARTGDDGPEPELAAVSGLGDQFAGHEPADPAETVENDVGVVVAAGLHADEMGELRRHEGLGVVLIAAPSPPATRS